MSTQTLSGIGQPLPDITLSSVDGGRISLAELRGRRRLLFHWASW